MRDLYDIHCHILPGVDDGAKDMDMALSMIEKEIDAGVETIILTPLSLCNILRAVSV